MSDSDHFESLFIVKRDSEYRLLGFHRLPKNKRVPMHLIYHAEEHLGGRVNFISYSAARDQVRFQWDLPTWVTRIEEHMKSLEVMDPSVSDPWANQSSER